MVAVLWLCLMSAMWCQKTAPSSEAGVSVPLGLAAIPWPGDNPYSSARVELGKMLFFDSRLSGNAISCASCHEPSHAFSGGVALSTGASGRLEDRHTPTIINRAWGKSQLWDGRLPTLEAQVQNAVTNLKEMGTTTEQMTQGLRSFPGYGPLFAAAFGDSTITFERVAQAIATFERSIVSGNSAYDRYLAGDKTALTKRQRAGLDFFNHKGQCAECHSGRNLTTEKFVNTGIGTDRVAPDPGREVVTNKHGDYGKFKVPTLRDIARRGPYMHDGRFKTLAEVLDFYAKGGVPNPQLDTRLTPFYMDEQSRQELLSFLDSLNGEGWQTISPPSIYPQ